MNLHTQDLVSPIVWLIAQVTYLKHWVVRLVVIGSKNAPGDVSRRPRYMAIGLLNKRQWVDGFEEVHKLVSNKKAGRLVGKTFREKNMEVLQNQLLLARFVPSFIIPAYLRAFVSNTNVRWWTIEVYSFYAINKKGELGKYGTFIEVSPRPRTFHPRHTLGVATIWQRAGRQLNFEEYLRMEIPAKLEATDAPVAERARVFGWALSLPALYVFSVLARKAWLHEMKCGGSKDCRRCHAT